MLPGRRRECEFLKGLLEGVHAGHGTALVVHGEAGVGKTALLDEAFRSASDVRMVRAVGVESEMELAFAALHQLCGSMLDRIGRLREPQSDALATAFGLKSGPAPDRFLVGLALLSLLSGAAEERPLLCVVDDAQWLDRSSAQALAFAARRLLATSVLMVFATRELSEDFRGLPELEVEGLRNVDARELLHSAIPWPLDEPVRERILAEARGNPLALLELPQGLSPAELAGGLMPPGAMPLSGRIEESFRRRLERLPDETRLLLVIAAAEPVGDPALVWGAARRIGLSVKAADHRETAGLVDIGAGIVFRHPLVRSAAYRAASLSDRQRAHAALAELTDSEVDPDRRAWHRAQATSGPDEDVAADLERSAGRAQRRGGLAAAAAFLERTVGLTLDPVRRSQRALAAALAKYFAGAPDAALRLLAAAEAGSLNELERARGEMLRAEIAYTQNRGSDAPQLLLRAAKRLEPLNAGLARETYLDAVWAARFAGRLARGTGLQQVAEAALTAPPPVKPHRASDLLLDGLARTPIEGYGAGAAMLKEAVSAFRSKDVAPDEELRWLCYAGVAALDLWDDESFDVLAARHIELGRKTGALIVLPIAYSACILAHAFAGRLVEADHLIEELRTVTDAIGSQFPPYGPTVVAAWRGREAEASTLIDTSLGEVKGRGEGAGVGIAQYSLAVLYNGLGRYEEALAAAKASDHPEVEGFAVTNLGVVELIEAADRAGSLDEASDALKQLSERSHISGTDWALGLEARSRALLSKGEVAELLYQEAIQRLGRTRIRVQLARGHLLYGEWLRRENRRVDAREQLRTAHEMLNTMGIEGYAERARRELLATGEVVRKRTVETLHDLTAQEAQIARLAGAGRTNPEIGVQLFISARTVEWHLSKVFTKLGVSSRQELRTLPDFEQVALPV